MKDWNNNPLIRQFERFQQLSPHNTMSAFAERCGVSKSMMSRYLNNHSLVSAASMAKICKALKCQMKDVIRSERDERQ